MIKLPPTGIDISQSDLQTQLQHLDFCAGLLKQGFKKHEIAQYFRERNTNEGEPCEQGISTYELLSRAGGSEKATSAASSSRQKPEDETQAQFASPIRSPDCTVNRSAADEDLQPASSHCEVVVGKKMHAPRQSSLLRFARAVSSETSDPGDNSVHFSPRPNITYRSRSETYSYDQSEMDEEDLVDQCTTPMEKLEQLSLDDDQLVNTGSTNATVHIMSSLRPDAQPFTPSLVQPNRPVDALESPDPLSLLTSDPVSFPSSPPEISPLPDINQTSSPSSLSAPHTPSVNTRRSPSTVQPRSLQQFLDGSFTVYNDSVAARLQPQTPAELDRSHFLSQFNAAYTAPPGMVRSSAARQGLRTNRQVSGELSPTAQASMIRERRQREFRRGLRVEGLRIDRTRTDTRDITTGSRNDVDPFNIWRDDLDADGVGEENFEDATTGSMLRRMRAVSGNRRLV